MQSFFRKGVSYLLTHQMAITYSSAPSGEFIHTNDHTLQNVDHAAASTQVSGPTMYVQRIVTAHPLY